MLKLESISAKLKKKKNQSMDRFFNGEASDRAK